MRLRTGRLVLFPSWLNRSLGQVERSLSACPELVIKEVAYGL
jgi:hypothetical protein